MILTDKFHSHALRHVDKMTPPTTEVEGVQPTGRVDRHDAGEDRPLEGGRVGPDDC